MKIYKPEPLHFVRLQVTRQGEETQYLTLVETTKEVVRDYVMELIQHQHISPFNTGRRTSVNIRDAIGGKNGESISLSFHGMTAQATMELIKNNIPSG